MKTVTSLLILALLTPSVNAMGLNPFAECGALNFDNSECANYAAKKCGYVDNPDTASNSCLFTYGYRPKFQRGADGKQHFCGFSTTESRATVWGDCSGSRG